MRHEIKKELSEKVGPDNATDSPEHIIAYSYDAYTEEHRPDIVLFPVSTEQVSAVMKVAYRENIPVTPRGAGTNLAGESIPVRGGIALCLTKMDRILSIDATSLVATVQPGVINLDFQRQVEKQGMMYPPDPASWAVATMGGTVATNAGGPRTVKYGVTKDYLLGLTAVLANGDVLKTGGRTLKNVTGYNLTTLLCGSEGTLGIITEIIVRLIPKPQASRTLRAEFEKLEDCSDAVAAIMAGGTVPAALELMDQFAVKAVEKSFGLGLNTDMEGVLLIQLDGYFYRFSSAFGAICFKKRLDSIIDRLCRIMIIKKQRSFIIAPTPAVFIQYIPGIPKHTFWLVKTNLQDVFIDVSLVRTFRNIQFRDGDYAPNVGKLLKYLSEPCKIRHRTPA